MYEIWVTKPGQKPYRLDDDVNLSYNSVLELVEQLKKSEAFNDFEIEIRIGSNVN